MSADGRLTYLLTFDRIGRSENWIVSREITVTVDPGPVDAVADQIAEAAYRHARPWIASRELDVTVSCGTGDAPSTPTIADLDGAQGRLIVGGVRSAGNFTVKAVAPC